MPSIYISGMINRTRSDDCSLFHYPREAYGSVVIVQLGFDGNNPSRVAEISIEMLDGWTWMKVIGSDHAAIRNCQLKRGIVRPSRFADILLGHRIDLEFYVGGKEFAQVLKQSARHVFVKPFIQDLRDQ